MHKCFEGILKEKEKRMNGWINDYSYPFIPLGFNINRADVQIIFLFYIDNLQIDAIYIAIYK